MARGGATAINSHVNGDFPPPSTLAAQIVHNQTAAPAVHQNGETQSFAALLHEILHNHAATVETDIETNVKLLKVVAEAGLAPLAGENPFAPWDVLIPQAVDSIAVIEQTIKRQPGLLFARSNLDEPQALLPLLVRLLAVCGKPKCEGLPIARLVGSLLHALDSSTELWRHSKGVRDIIEDCVADVIGSLEASTRSKVPFTVKLPPARSIARLWPASEKAIALPHGCQTILDEQAHGFMLVLELSQIPRLSTSWRTEIQRSVQKLFASLRLPLETTKQWQPALLTTLGFQHPLPALVTVLSDSLKVTPSLELQIQAAQCVMNTLRSNISATQGQILPLLSSLASSKKFDNLHEDLKIASVTVICRLCKPEEWPATVYALHDALRQDNVMTDSNLQEAFQELSIPKQIYYSDRLQRRKRRKLDLDQPDDQKVLIRKATKLLTRIESEDLSALPEFAPSVYRSLSETDQIMAWQALSDLAKVDLEAITNTVKTLIEDPESILTKKTRVLCLLAIQQCVGRMTESPDLDLAKSTFGQLCLRGLHSSLRELRVAAGQCLQSFLRNNLKTELAGTNCKVALEYLRALSDRGVASEQETLVSTWAQVARVCGDSELNLCLLRLVDYLGHANPIISGLAFTELERIAEAKGVSTSDLFKPFWTSIAVSAVQDLQSRPQKAQQLSDLLEMDVNHFLIRTQKETIPTLVLTRRRNILQRIADARGHGTSVQDLILQPRTNLMATLALLLTQPGSDVEEAAIACLIEVAPNLRGTDLTDLIKIDSTILACNMLQHIGEQSESRKSRAYQAFQLFASLTERRPGQAKLKPSRMVTEFFDTHILGIMTHYSEIIENFQGIYTKTERLRCVRAIAEMINMAKSQVSGALPQIRAALQSSMDHVDLCDASFAAWLNLLPVLGSHDIGAIVDQTFALVLTHWANLSSDVQSRCHERISSLVKNHNHTLQENIMTLPSLTGIPLLSKLSAEIERLKASEPVEIHCKAFTKRLGHESKVVVLRALEELYPFLERNQDFIYDFANSVQPTSVLSELLRVLLDVNVKYASESVVAAEMCGKALGIIGCLDPDRVDATRKNRQLLVLSNFDRASEVEDWTLALLEDVLVKAFKSVNNARAQGFLAFVMQELLRFCDFNDGTVLRPRASQAPSKHQKWMKLPDHVRIILTPLVNSRYVVTSSVAVTAPNRAYPGFSPDSGHSSWLRSLVYDLMWKAKGDNAQMVFPLIARTIRAHDLAIATFLLPYAFLNVVLGGTVDEIDGLKNELLAVLGSESATNQYQWETIKLCSESVFNVLDYMSLWLQEKKKALGETRAIAFRTGHSPNDFDETRDMDQIATVERFLTVIPADVIANRAIMCGSYARALFNWEQHIRRIRPLIPSSRPSQSPGDDGMLYDKLFDIYAQIEEPDGLEGISAHLSILNENQQAMQHARAGRWTAAQAWCELQMGANPNHLDLELRLLGCFRETGRFEPLLKYANSFLNTPHPNFDRETVESKLNPGILEGHMMMGNVEGMLDFLESNILETQTEFMTEIARTFLIMDKTKEHTGISQKIKDLRTAITRSMTFASTSSIQGVHEDLKKLHVLHEMEKLCSSPQTPIEDIGATLDRRLSIIGSYVLDKQYVLGIRRAVMQELDAYDTGEIGSSWLTTAKLARQAGNTEHSYSAVLKAFECGDQSAKIEEAKLLWRDGHQRHAIHALETAIASGVFENITSEDRTNLSESTVSTRSTTNGPKQNPVAGKVHLLLAKWLDATGHTQTQAMAEKYQRVTRYYSRWEKGHYYLGKHYQKLLDAEKALPVNKQSMQYRSGELTRLVVENLVRSIPFGNKYWHEVIPKVLTLWLDLGSTTIKRPTSADDRAAFDRRVAALQSCNRQVSKYLIDRVPPYVYYSAVPQMMSRITHPNPEVWKILATLLTKVSSHHPNQVLWSLLAVTRSKDRMRTERGTEILNQLRDPKTKAKSVDGSSIDLRVMIAQAQKMCDGLLRVCDTELDKHSRPEMRLSEHFGFNHKLAPCPLVVPLERTLMISLPNGANHDTIKRYKAFVQDKVTIQSFAEEVLILSSLMKPRKLTVRGSDGKQYGLMCKPRDDLRKDRRLMEFNGIINRTLKRDAESSKRRLYVKTYAVTPLSEESGIIEWVEGIKPMRDILLPIYNRKGIRPNYNQLKEQLEEACSTPENGHLFVEKVLSKFPPALHEWFTEIYPEPEAWFAARLRYARSAAVMSMAGHVLGLGDRHGENILLEESTGGVFHVDFNCLFDKGLTFEKPELVPFRLTHNMVDAMGPYGAEGPFRKSSELTMRLLRQSKDTLMTVLETFLYDPTTDFVEQKKHPKPNGVPNTPQEILESVEGKLKGLWKSERVPLGVEGYVDALIKEATSPFNLASMYLGWCAFL